MRLLRAVYSVYIGLLFLICLIAVIPIYVVALAYQGERRLTVMFAANRYAMRCWSILSGVRIVVEGSAAWSPAPVIVGNHCNLLDMPVCAVAFARPAKVLAKQEFARMPLLGFLFRQATVLVERDSPESRQRSLAVLRDALGKGWPVFIFPEGTRNRGETPLQTFRDGPFRFAIAAQAPVQPFVQLHMRSVQAHNSLLFKPGKVVFRWLPPIQTTGLTDDDVVPLRERVYALIEAELKRDDAAFRAATTTDRSKP
jgi:1-acyl-sn-glycerol-3-phosphate acyltransferase